MATQSSAARTPFCIVPATVDDLDVLAQLSGDAFLNDTHTLLKAHWLGNNSHRDETKEDLARLLTNERVDMLVARKSEDGAGEIIGSIVWVKVGYPKNDGSDAPARPMFTSKATTLPPPPAPVPPPFPDSPLTIAELAKTTSNAMTHYIDHLMPPGTQCRLINRMNVAPGYQGQGIGSALIKWGTDKADADGVFCWVSSSMDGYHVYAKAGFVEVGRQELCLDDYAQGVKRRVLGDDGKEVEEDWGVYVWRWMRRDPK